jgi:hypothetical protein
MLAARKGLSTLRRQWQTNSLETPFVPTHTLGDSEENYAQFSLRMLLLAQERRHQRRRIIKK